MARSQFWDTAIDQLGNAITTSRVTVYEYGTSTLSTVYANEIGSTLKGNPFNATTGFIDFWMEPGSYDVVIADTAIPAAFTTRTVRFDSIPGVEGVLSQTISDGAVTNADVFDSAAIEQRKFKNGDPITDVPDVSSLVDNDEFYYEFVGGTNIKKLWSFKFVSGKWVFTGGSPMSVYSGATDTGISSTTYNVWSGISLSLTVPKFGEYIVQFGAKLGGCGGSDHLTMCMEQNGVVEANGTLESLTNVSPWIGLHRERSSLALDEGEVITLKFKVTGGTGTVDQPYLSILPIRIEPN